MTIQVKTYECPICYGVNHVNKLQCSTCGTTPAQYSVTRKPIKLLTNDMGYAINGFLEVVNAIGVDRTERHRTVRRTLRTVPADYYAGVE